MLHSPGLAVDLHVSAIFCSGYQCLRGRHSLFIGVAVPEDFLPFHTVDLLASLIFIYYTLHPTSSYLFAHSRLVTAFR
jgi:hypothetical protein